MFAARCLAALGCLALLGAAPALRAFAVEHRVLIKASLSAI